MRFLISYAGYDGPRRTRPASKPATRHERKWLDTFDQAARSQAAMEEMNRTGLALFGERGMPGAYREIVRQVANKHRVNVMLIASNSRMQIAVLPRNEAMYRIRAQDPENISTPKLGRWFGKDHTSALHCIASHQERHGLPKLVGYDIAKARLRNVGISAKLRLAQTG